MRKTLRAMFRRLFRFAEIVPVYRQINRLPVIRPTKGSD